MIPLSKISLIHSLLNRKYNFLIRFLIAIVSWVISFFFTIDLVLSNYIFKEIFHGNDLKTAFRRLLWIIKNSFLQFPYSTDLMFDFCMGLNLKELRSLKKILNTRSPRKLNIFYEIDLLRVIAYQIEVSSLEKKNMENNHLKEKFLIKYFIVKNLLNKSRKIYLEQTKEKKLNSKLVKFGMNIKDAKNTLVDIDEFFSSCGFSWFAIGGTLLGFIREKSFLKHDLDLDIGIKESSFSFDVFKDRIKKNNNLNVSRIEYQKEYFDKKKYLIRPVFIRIIHKSGLNVDCFLHFESNGKICHGTSSLLWENSTFELSNYKIFNLSIKVPKNSNLYLTETYGNWGKEKKDYNYHRDMNSLSGANNYLGLEYILRVKLFCGRDNQEKLNFLEKLLF